MKTKEKNQKTMWRALATIAIPITLQSLFQSSLSVVDQIMVGQLGTNSISGIGLGSKFPSLFLVTLTALVTTASIMVSQYYGKRDEEGLTLSFLSNLYLAAGTTVLFLLPSLFIPGQIMRLYTTDPMVIKLSATYLQIIAVGYIPIFITAMVSVMLRNLGHGKYPMFASIASVLLNTALNYLLIFGKFGCPKLGLTGAAIATTITRIIECGILLMIYLKIKGKLEYRIVLRKKIPAHLIKQTLIIASPVLLNEFLWGLGETVYAMIYGRISTQAVASMTLTAPIQGLTIGLFSGVAAASGIMVGNRLGENDTKNAYHQAIQFIKIGVGGSLILAVTLSFMAQLYIRLFKIDAAVGNTTILILRVFAVFLVIKVTNMILAGGILRSGGKTKYTLYLDIIGTWGIGVPLGLLAAFVWKLPIYWVYGILSIEEAVRFFIEIWIFRSRIWMENITTKKEMVSSVSNLADSN